MRQVKEILRQKWALGRSHREIASALGLSAGVIAKTVSRAAAAKLELAEVEALSEQEAEQRLYGPTLGPRTPRPRPDPAYIHAERRRPGVTLELLHLEYLEKHPDGYRYTQFCEVYRQWLKKRRLSMRQVHRAGEKLFTDYSGKKPSIVDPATGEVIEVELFVAALGASSFTYSEATMTQRVSDWVGAHVRTYEYLGGVPRDTVPDQLRSAVSRPCRYEPVIQRTYDEMGRHYGTTIVPARPAHPRDKAKVEVAVQVAQRWILARLRHRTFFSLAELNEAIAELVEQLNDRPMKLYGASRRELFERLDRPALRPLPAERFEPGEWHKGRRANIDYHVEVEGHYYSVPYQLRGEEIEARKTRTMVELYHQNERVASHPRNTAKGRHTTNPEHMPKAHQAHLEWSPSRFVRWAQSIGPQTAKLVEAILAERPHPEQGYRSCLGILRLGKRYGDERLEAACARAFAAGARSYRHVDSILRHGLDRAAARGAAEPARTPLAHGNIRGRDYYH